MKDKGIRVITLQHSIYRRLASTLALILLLSAIFLQSACLPFSLKIKSSTIIDPSDTGQLTDNYTTSDLTQTSSTAAESFEVMARRLILDGLLNRQQAIDISEAIQPNTITESEVQSTIDLVFKIYQNIYCRHPEYFYLNGSINASYSISGVDGDLETMTIKPEYWPEMANMSSAKLDLMTGEINQQVDKIAASVRQQTTVPWQQLQLIHDSLIQGITYDLTLDQANNQVYSALIEKSTMCQGYAQAFQLIGQQLGFEIVLAIGEAAGIGHAWDIVSLNDQYYHIDVTFDDPTPDGGAGAPVQHIHLLRSDKMMRESHIWIAEDFPACPEDGAQFYREQNLIVDSQTALKSELRKFIRSIDFNTKQSALFEVLFTGADLPDDAGLEEMIRSVLSDEAAAYSVMFSHQVSKQVVVVEITPDN